MGAAAVALAIGLPFLYVIIRVAGFYSYADAGFGYWMATRALPGWAILAVVLGLIVGIRSANRKRSLGYAFGQACLWSVGLATLATGLSFAATTSLRASAFERYGLPPTPLSHVLLFHLFDSQAEQKLRFDLCLLSEKLPGTSGGSPRGFAYDFCIPDVDSLRMQVMAIDTTARVAVGSGKNRCGPGRVMLVGSTRQDAARQVLLRLASLPYVRRIIPTPVE